jgi:hypothetical protein
MNPPRGASPSGGGLTGRLAQFQAGIGPGLDRAQEKLRSTPLLVLVFGSGKGGKNYGKRVQIRNELNRLPGVTAVFPEQSEFTQQIRNRFRIAKNDAVTLETVLVEIAEVVIALEPGSGGVEGEVARFASSPKIGAKFFNLLPKKYREQPESFPAQIRRYVETCYYTPSDLRDCDLATRICPEHVMRRKIEKTLCRP